MPAANPGPASRWFGLFLACLLAPASLAAPSRAAEAKPDPETLLGQALEIAAKDVNLLLGVARTQIATDRKKAARTTLQQAFADQEWRPKDEKIADKLRQIALLQADAGDRDGSAKTIAQVLDWADTLPDGRHHRECLKTLATRMQAGDVDGAFQMLDKQTAARGQYFSHLTPKPGDKKTLLRVMELLFQEHEIAQRNYLPRLLGMQATQGDLPGALENAKRLGPHRPRALQAIVQAQVRQKDWKAALETVQEIPAGPLRADVLAAVAPVQFDAGEREAAKKLLAEAVKLAEERKETPEPKANPQERRGGSALFQHSWDDAWAAIVRAQARMRDFPAALTSVARLPGPKRGAVLLDLARQQASAGDREGAKKSLAGARSLADQAAPARFPDGGFADQPQGSALYSIALAQADTGDYAGALQTADAIASGFLPDAARERVVQRQAEAGDVAGALKLARTIANEGYRGQAVMRVARGQARAGRAEDALQWAKELEPPAVRAHAYLGIVEGLAKKFLPRVSSQPFSTAGRPRAMID